MLVIKNYPGSATYNIIRLEVFPPDLLQAGEVQDPLIELRPDKTGWQVFYQGELTLAQLLANLQLELPPGHQVLRDRRMIQGEEILRNGDRIVILPVPLAGG